MKLQLSNYRTECEPRVIDVTGNPLLTYGELRAGDGVPGQGGGDTRTVAYYDTDLDFWVLVADESQWTDIEVVDRTEEPGASGEKPTLPEIPGQIFALIDKRGYDLPSAYGPFTSEERAERAAVDLVEAVTDEDGELPDDVFVVRLINADPYLPGDIVTILMRHGL